MSIPSNRSRAISLFVVPCLLFLANSAVCVEISNFTGADPGEGLDFQGNFVYAVNISGPGDQEIYDATFTDDDADGFFVEASHNLPDWATPQYGDSPADDELEFIMESIRWSNVPANNPPTVNIEMAVEAGQSYKMQMLFTESCCDRGFDIFFEDEVLVDDFAIYEHHVDDIWNIVSREDGVVITHEFTAGDDLLELALGTDAPDFPDNNGHISAITLETAAVLAGDFDGDNELTAADIDRLNEAIRMGSTDSQFDLDNNQVLDRIDRQVWVEELKRTWFGDSDLDGEFNSKDLVRVFQRGEYEDRDTGNSIWEDGDWNGDADFDSSDFVVAFQGGGYEVGPRPDEMAAVPEPSGLALMCVGLALICHRPRRRR